MGQKGKGVHRRNAGAPGSVGGQGGGRVAGAVDRLGKKGVGSPRFGFDDDVVGLGDADAELVDGDRLDVLAVGGFLDTDDNNIDTAIDRPLETGQRLLRITRVGRFATCDDRRRLARRSPLAVTPLAQQIAIMTLEFVLPEQFVSQEGAEPGYVPLGGWIRREHLQDVPGGDVPDLVVQKHHGFRAEQAGSIEDMIGGNGHVTRISAGKQGPRMVPRHQVPHFAHRVVEQAEQTGLQLRPQLPDLGLQAPL